MQRWERAATKFVRTWRRKPGVIGALLTGSYAVGLETPRSDVDVIIVLADGGTAERGNRLVDGFLIEYFADTVRTLLRRQRDDFLNCSRAEARMIAMGKIVFDRTGAVHRLQERSRRRMKQPFRPRPPGWIELKKYELWDRLETLRDLAEQKSPSFAFVYHHAVLRALVIYSAFARTEVFVPEKFYRALKDPSFCERYLIEHHPDKRFARLAAACVERAELKRFEKLCDHVLGAMGGSPDMRRWSLRGEL